MEKQTLQQFEAQCIQDEPPACQTWCPLHLEARTFAGHMAAGRTGEARKILDRHLPLSGLSGYLCEGPCQTHCRRAEVDQGINLPLLERHCLSRSKASRPFPLPATGRSAAVFGAGLAGLALAWELGRKGHQLTVFHSGAPGGRLAGLSPARLPEAALAEALEQLAVVRVRFEPAAEFSPGALKRARADFQAVFLSFDDPALTPGRLGLDQVPVDPVTAAFTETVFARPPERSGEIRFIDDLAAAKKAAGSIDRLLAGVSPAAAREGEGPYPTRLYTSLADIPVQTQAPPADPLAPTDGEALAEAGRCLDCRCLECVKKCVYLRHYGGYPKKYAREIYNNVSTAFGIRKSNTMILSCAECGLCREVCPRGADMGAFVGQARLDMAAGRHMPVSAHEFALEDLVFSNSPQISFFRHEPGRESGQWLFFPGCQLPASRPGATARVYDHLRKHLEGGVGFMLACCGAPARWSGRPLLTGETVGAFRETWRRAGEPKVIAACASCAAFFQAELPEAPVVSLWRVLAGLPLPPEATRSERVLALHDPCAARLDAETQKSVRVLAGRLGQPIAEWPDGRLTRCCGYGGLAAAANPDLGDSFARERAGEAEAPILAYCIMCRDRLAGVGHPTAHFCDLLFPQGLSPDEAAAAEAPGWSDRRESRAGFRRELLSKLWGEEAPEEGRMDDPVIHISEEVARTLERRRILRADVLQVLREIEAGGAPFVHPETGRRLASLRPRQVTFWVEYSPREDGSFDLHDAYCHRMVVQGVPGEGAESPASREGFDPKGGRV